MLLYKTLRSSTLRLALVYVGGFSAAICALLLYVYAAAASYQRQRFDDAIAVERRVLAAAYERSGSKGLADLIERRIADAFFYDWAYLVVDAASRFVAGNLAAWPAQLAGAKGSGDIILLLSGSGAGERALRVSYETLSDGSRLLLGRNSADLDRMRRSVVASLFATALLFLTLATAAGISTSRRSVARIEAINATSRKIMQAGLGERIPLRGTRDEWDELASNLNSMLTRIEELTQSTREVADNIAHDLRTPLTHLRGRLERAAAGPVDLAGYRRVMADAIGELDGILTTFASLLRISRIEMQQRTAGFRRLDLADIAREVADLFDPTAEEAGVRLRLDIERQIEGVGDRDLLFEAIANLIDNAIKHGGSGGEVAIGTTTDRGGAAFWVSDLGPGIPPEERDHVLRRFYRLERSRHSPGNGLGLSLVAAVAALHGADLRMTDKLPGLRIALHFP